MAAVKQCIKYKNEMIKGNLNIGESLITEKIF